VRNILLVAATLAVANTAHAQATVGIPQDSATLHRAIFSADSAMFDAFNRCDSIAMARFVTDDLEFYHDWGGQVGPKDKFLAGFAEGCRRGEVGRRELVGGMEVHLMRNVGALQVATHRFFVRNADGTERPGAISKLVTLWRVEDGAWRQARVFSYDHRQQR